MSSLTKPYTFTANTYAVASQVNSDFDTLFNWVNTNAIWSDASVAFTGVPSGPGADPTAPNHLSRKQYSDQSLHFLANTGTTRYEFVHTMPVSITPNASGVFTVTFANPFPNICNLVIPMTYTSGVLVNCTQAPGTASWQGKAVTASTGAAFTTALFIGYIALGH